MIPVCLDDLLHAIRLDTSDVVPDRGKMFRASREQEEQARSHDRINSAFSFGSIFDMVADFITDASVSVISSARNIAQADEALEKHPVHTVLCHPMEVSTRCNQSGTCDWRDMGARPLYCLRVT